MTNPTSNFGWVMPTATDLVTDLPADFEVFGQAVDTSMADLKGGTTGQILSKATDADMDFVWTNGGDITAVTAGTGISGGGTSGDVTITNSMATAIDAKGDLIVGTANDTFSRLAVGGTNGQVLTVDSTAGTGIKWATPGGTTLNYTLLNSGGTALSGASTSISGLSGYNYLMFYVSTASTDASSSFIRIALNNLENNNYTRVGLSWNNTLIDQVSENNGSFLYAGNPGATAASIRCLLTIQGANSAGLKPFSLASMPNTVSSNSVGFLINGYDNDTNVISSVTFKAGSGNFDAGTVFVYGAN